MKNETSLDIADAMLNVLVRFSDGHVKTKNFDSRDVKDLVDKASTSASVKGSSSLDIVDERLNVIARFEDGHFRTQKFNSHEIEEIKESSTNTMEVYGRSDLDIVDEDKNVIARFVDGHIRTKNFDSSNIGAGGAETYCRSAYADYLNSGESVLIPTPDCVKNHLMITFSASVIESGAITLTYSDTDGYPTSRVDITPTSVKEYNQYNVEISETSHGLTFSDIVVITIQPHPDTRADLTITTNGGSTYTQEVFWHSGGKECKVTVSDGSYYDARLSIDVHGYARSIWFIGDSWMDYWGPCAHDLGADNILLLGFRGANSNDGISIVEEALKHGKPSRLIWALGMNDGDSSTSVNASWYDVFIRVVALCKVRGIDLTVVTICNTPAIINKYKNDIIRESGVKYLDLADYTRCNGIGEYGPQGFIGTDGVHPTKVGSMVVATFFANSISKIKEN